MNGAVEMFNSPASSLMDVARLDCIADRCLRHLSKKGNRLLLAGCGPSGC
jgi:hypothetical protein